MCWCIMQFSDVLCAIRGQRFAQRVYSLVNGQQQNNFFCNTSSLSVNMSLVVEYVLLRWVEFLFGLDSMMLVLCVCFFYFIFFSPEPIENSYIYLLLFTIFPEVQ